MDLEPDARARRLEQIGQTEPGLKDYVEALLRSAASGSGVLERAIEDAAQGVVSEASFIGQEVGPYRLLRELGRGGMGAVYLAERVDGQFEQQVAIKLMLAGALNPKIVERFRTERQILARLDHPNIARLFDGGTTAEGLPYFVMEHVAGEPIDVYCDRRRLRTHERLALFRTVCSAVESAHRQLVVHRDLKPWNILVTDEGAPKLLDFGIAKLVEPDDSRAAVTMAGERAMTLEYASPEQVRGEPVSTATDVYALGLLLYELLTGRRAHRLTSSQPTEVERVVCEMTPERPSTVVTQEFDESEDGRGAGTCTSAEEVSEARCTDPAKLKRHLVGDLDNIVLQALRKEPERRYASVGEFSDDVRRHLEGLPVRAHEDSWSYRTQKFVRRHRWALAAAALIVLSLVAGLVGTTIQARRANREALRAEEVSEFLVNLLELSDPEKAQGREVTVREVLDRAALRIESELGRQPELQATLQTMIGRLYLQLGQYKDSEAQLREAWQRRQSLLGADHADVGETLELLASALVGQGRFEDAVEEARRSLEIRRAALGANSSETAESLGVLGLVQQKRGEFDRARESYEEALAIKTELFGEDHVDIARIGTNFAYSEIEAGRLGRAEELQRHAVEIWRRQGAGKSLHLASALAALSGPLMLKESLDDAESLLLESHEIRRQLLPANHPLVAESLTNMGILRRRQGRMAEAEDAYQQALKTSLAALGPEHPQIGTLYNNLAVLMHVQDRFEEAANYYRRSLELRRRVLGQEHPLVGTTMSFLAFALHRAGDGRAEALYRDALTHLQASRDHEHPDVANVHNDLGRLLVERGRYQEAEPYLRAALKVRGEVFGEENRRTVNSRLNLGGCLVGQGELAEAEELLVGVRSYFVEKYSEDSWQIVEVEIFLAHLLARQGKRDEALAQASASLEKIQAAKGDDHWLTRFVRTIQKHI